MSRVRGLSERWSQERTAVSGRQPFGFVVGAERSGTTLLRFMLDSHPQLVVPPEAHFVIPLLRRRRLYECRGGFATERFIDDLALPDGWPPSSTLAAALRLRPPVDLADALRRVYGAHAAAHGKSRFADKTPSHARHMLLLAAVFPESRFVHLIRDGRDVARSLQETDWGANTLAANALRWRRWVARARRTGMRLSRKRYLEVRYELLVTEPEAVLRRICAFLELPFDWRMLSYPTRAAELLATTPAADNHQRLLDRPTPGLRDWRLDMDAADVGRVQMVAGRVLAALGYELAPVHVSPHARVVIAAQVLTEVLWTALRRTHVAAATGCDLLWRASLQR